MIKRMNWARLEDSLKTQSRFINRTATRYLASIFAGLNELETRDGRRLVVDAGPGAAFHAIYRARVFESDERLEAALARPDIHLGPPASHLASAGRMNAQGISVFYGASTQKAAIAEVRPPVNAQIAVAQFQIIRKLRFLDLTVLDTVRDTDSLADFGLSGRREDAILSIGSKLAPRIASSEDVTFA